MTFNENMTVILNPLNDTPSGTQERLLCKPVGKKIQMSGPHSIGQDIYILLFGNVYNWRYFSIDKTPEDYIRRMYIKFGIEYTLQKLEGVFSIILLDQRIELEQSKLYVSIDHIGLIPIYITQHDNYMFIISNKKTGISTLDPGTFYTFTLSHKVISDRKSVV